MGRAHDFRVVHIDPARRGGKVRTYGWYTGWIGWLKSTLGYASPHVTSGCGCLKGRFKCPSLQVFGYVLTSYNRKFRVVGLYRRASIHTVPKTLSTSRKTAPVSSKSLWILVLQGGWAVAKCCVWVWTQTAHCAVIRVRSLRRESWRGFSRTVCQSIK